jgi:TolA-binding protein
LFGALAVVNDFSVGTTGAFAVLAAIVGGVFGWLVQRGKSESDQSVAVLAEWSKLNTGLARRLTDVERECAQMRKDHAAEIERIGQEHAAQLNEMRDKHRAEMRSMRELNEGLQRMIAQNSKSTAYLIGDFPGEER